MFTGDNRLNNSLKPIEILKSKSSSSFPTMSSGSTHLLSSSLSHNQLFSNDKDIYNDEQSSSFLSQTHPTEHDRPFEHKPFIVLNQNNVSEPTSSTSSSSSSATLPSESSRDIIVRPQWLRRSNESSSGFQACVPSDSVTNKSKSNNFPYTPVILFVNRYSGGQYGEKIYRQLIRKLNPRQVFLLENDATIINALGTYYSLPNIRLCVLGGDGSAAWVLGRLAEVYPSSNNPPVSFYPLGTANDLSRILSWGHHYDSKRLFPLLLRIPYAQVIPIDRWQVDIEQLDMLNLTPTIQQHSRTGLKISRPFQALLNPPKFVRKTNRVSFQNHRTLPNTCFINYMSFGLDAAIAIEFHDQRTRDPNKFSSPLKNKLMYLNESCKYLSDFSRSKMWSLRSYIRLICDGENLTDAVRDYHTLLIINIPAYASGTNPWGNSSLTSSTPSNTHQSQIIQKDTDSLDHIATSSADVINSSSNKYKMYESVTLNSRSVKQTTIPSATTHTADSFEQQDFSDRKIEVVGLSATRMASIHIGCRGNRIAQCNHVRVEVYCPMTAQMDGEPFYLSDSVAVNISYGGQVLVLRNED
ncbi:unnamed protein product [Rotaria sp. Silwood2]|nr:unnamed protein product [Rotaria sp. Silwood2]CAF3873462.1 unnamed protein product [Rotaria sp. Silwood2]